MIEIGLPNLIIELGRTDDIAVFGIALKKTKKEIGKYKEFLKKGD